MNRNNKFIKWIKESDKLFLIIILLICLKDGVFLALIPGTNSTALNIESMYFTKPPIVCHILFVVILASIGLIFKGRGRAVYYIVMDVLVSMLLWADMIYYRAYGGFLSASYITHPGVFNPSDRNLLSYAAPIDILFFADIIIFVIFGKFIFTRYKGRFKNGIRNFAAALIIIGLSCGYIYYSHYTIDILDVTNGDMMFLKTAWAPRQTMSNTSPIGYHFLDIVNSFTVNREKDLTAEDMEKIEKWYEDNDENLPDNEYKGILSSKNVIFLQVESLENFVINETVNGEEITPNMNKMLNNSYYFSNVYEQVNNGTSADGDLISNTSLFPVKEGAAYFRYPYNSYNSMARILKSERYKAISTHPEKSGSWNWRNNHTNYGFDVTYDDKDYIMDDIIGAGLSDESFYRQLVDKLKNEKEPFFVQAATLTSHGPFDLPEEKKELNLSDNLKDTKLGNYFQSIHYVDKEIGNLVDMLEENGLMENTVLVIYGDHAGPHKFYQDEVEAIEGIKDEWKNPEKKVPFIIYNPSIDGKTVATIGGQTDIVPTVLYTLGVDKSKYINTAMGRNLLNTERNFTVSIYGEIIGTPLSDSEAEHMKEAPEIGNMIIEGNYFKKAGIIK